MGNGFLLDQLRGGFALLAIETSTPQSLKIDGMMTETALLGATDTLA